MAYHQKIIPLPLIDLLNLSDKVRSPSTASGEQRVCHACGKRKDSLLKCARCRLRWYCDKVLQITRCWNDHLLTWLPLGLSKNRMGCPQAGLQASEVDHGFFPPKLG